MKIVFFGDSVTEGCFDIIRINGKIEILRDVPSGYASLVADALKSRYENIETINAGISGNSSEQGLSRINEDVIKHSPDLVIMCFGLNDVYMRDTEQFGNNLGGMFKKLRDRNIEVIYMSPNMLNKYVSDDVPHELIETATDCADCQNTGILDNYVASAKELSKQYGVYFVDAYAKWKQLNEYGIDTTALLCNLINHPKRQMHKMFADMILETIEKEQLVY